MGRNRRHNNYSNFGYINLGWLGTGKRNGKLHCVRPWKVLMGVSKKIEKVFQEKNGSEKQITEKERKIDFCIKEVEKFRRRFIVY